MAIGNANRGLIAVDKMGGKVLFIDPATHATIKTLDGFQRNPHELLVSEQTGLAYVPIFGDGVHGRNPNPGHTLCVIDLVARECVADIDLTPLVAPHTLRFGPDGLIYMTCENSAAVAIIDPTRRVMVGMIETGSTNGHRLIVAPDGERLYTENEEDASISVIDLPKRKLLGHYAAPQALAGIEISPDGRTLIAVSDEDPVVFLIEAANGRLSDTVKLDGVPKAAQIARFSPDQSLLAITSLQSGTISLMAPSLRDQTCIAVGKQPMDMAFHGDELFIGCQGDGSVHVIDVPGRRWKTSFAAGVGCECLGFF